jgi:phosphosulfolactate synthase (CoM biosynthesis protein A)
MIKEAPLKYTVVFYVEADRREALEAAVKYVMEYVKDGVAMYACGPYVCVCKVKLEWDGERLTVKTCLKRSVDTAVKWLLKAYVWHGGGSIRLIKCEEYKP